MTSSTPPTARTPPTPPNPYTSPTPPTPPAPPTPSNPPTTGVNEYFQYYTKMVNHNTIIISRLVSPLFTVPLLKLEGVGQLMTDPHHGNSVPFK